MKLRNLTPHEVKIVRGDEHATIPPSGVIPRVAIGREQVEEVAVNGLLVPVNQAVLGEIEDLPDPEPGVRLIVSRVVAEAAKEREDLLIPDEAVRDGEGRVIGCRALARV